MIDALPEELRVPLVLSASNELNSREIATILGIPEGTVRTRLQPARELLRERLARQGQRTRWRDEKISTCAIRPVCHLIDAALGTYGDAVCRPRSARVLSAIATSREAAGSAIEIAPVRRRWVPWAVAFPIAACLLLLWLTVPSRRVSGPIESQQAHQYHPVPEIVPRPVAPKRETRVAPPAFRNQAEKHLQPAQTTALPKLDVFPTPQPLTAQERALLVVTGHLPGPQSAGARSYE